MIDEIKIFRWLFLAPCKNDEICHSSIVLRLSGLLSKSGENVMNEKLSQYFNLEVNNYKNAVNSKNVSEAWIFLERAHILSQFHWKEHFYIHLRMLILALNTFDLRETVGQMARLVLAIPGSLLRIAPKGNVGSTRGGIFETMSIPDDLKKILDFSEIND